MMVSSVDICNRALSEIGTRSTIASLSEASREAVQCALWYDSLRKKLLRAAPWSFARRLVGLAQIGDLADGTGQWPWAFKYAYPSDCLRLRYILWPQPPITPGVPVTGDSLLSSACWTPSRHHRFMISSDPVAAAVAGQTQDRKVILSNVSQARAVYTGDSSDPSVWDDSFADALVALLAYKLVIPLSGNAGMKQGAFTLANQTIMEARAADGNEGLSSTDHLPDWIATRGAGTDPTTTLLAASGSWYEPYDNVTWGE